MKPYCADYIDFIPSTTLNKIGAHRMLKASQI